MIIDHIKHIGFYEPMAAGITGAWNAIQAMLQEKGELPDGRYELKRGFFKVQRGETKPLSEGTFESHRKYIDVQILLEGQEGVIDGDPRTPLDFLKGQGQRAAILHLYIVPQRVKFAHGFTTFIGGISTIRMCCMV